VKYIVYWVARTACELFRPRLKLPSRTSHTYYTSIDHRKGNAGIYAITRLFYENHFKEERTKCSRVMQRGYNMNIRCNQKLMYCKDQGIDFSVWLCRGYVLYSKLCCHFVRATKWAGAASFIMRASPFFG